MQHPSAMLIVSNLDGIAKLPPSGVLWSFSRMEDRIGRSLLYKLRSTGLIVRHDPGVYETTEELDEYVESKHGVCLGFKSHRREKTKIQARSRGESGMKPAAHGSKS